MKLFHCAVCAQALIFENVYCERCNHRLGYDADREDLVALEPLDGLWAQAGDPSKTYHFCDNARWGVCNWVLPASNNDMFCKACAHNHMVPDLTQDAHVAQWRAIENAKHRLFYALLRLKLPLFTRQQDPEEGLIFDFLAPSGVEKVITGHEHGEITLNISEADDATREKLRTQMGEPYRTLLGHMRHEIAHYYWDRLVRDMAALEPCRAVFGDERADYGEALKHHYDNPPPVNWQNNFVSTYATSHPWEDFAETFAHYLHIVDTLETARAFGLAVEAPSVTDGQVAVDFDPYRAPSAETLVSRWLPICFAVNSLNRSMGQPDIYPFVLSPVVIGKLDFIHDLVHRKFEGADAQSSAILGQTQASQPSFEQTPQSVLAN